MNLLSLLRERLHFAGNIPAESDRKHRDLQQVCPAKPHAVTTIAPAPGFLESGVLFVPFAQAAVFYFSKDLFCDAIREGAARWSFFMSGDEFRARCRQLLERAESHPGGVLPLSCADFPPLFMRNILEGQHSYHVSCLRCQKTYGPELIQARERNYRPFNTEHLGRVFMCPENHVLYELHDGWVWHMSSAPSAEP